MLYPVDENVDRWNITVIHNSIAILHVWRRLDLCALA